MICRRSFLCKNDWVLNRAGESIAMKIVAMASFCALSIALTACQAAKPYVAPTANKFDGRYVGTRRTVYPKCSANLDDMTLVVKDNSLTVRVAASGDHIPIDADGVFSGNASLMAASGKIVGPHLSMELVGTECFYRFELDKR